MIHVTLQQLTAYMDGELTDASTELVRRHLSECPECTGRFARLEEQEDWLVRMLKDEPDDDFFRHLKASISLADPAQAGKARPGDPRGKARGAKPAPAPAAAPRPKALPPPKVVARQGAAPAAATPLTALPPSPAPATPPTPPALPAPPALPTPLAAGTPPAPPARPASPVAPASTERSRPAPPSPLRTVNARNRREGDALRAASFNWIAATICVLLGIGIAYVAWGPKGGQPSNAGGNAHDSGSDPMWDSVTSNGTEASEEGARREGNAPLTEPEGESMPGAEEAAPLPSMEEHDGSRTEAPVTSPASGPDPRSSRARETTPLAASLAPALALPASPAPRGVTRREKTPPKTAPTPAPTPEKLVDRAPHHLVPVRTLITETVVAPADTAPAPAPSTPAGPAVASPSARTAAALREANTASLDASQSKRPEAFDAAATAWERTFSLLDGAPEEMAAARREWAQARYQAWAAEPTPERNERAIASARAYLLYAPPGPQRDQAWTWLARLKQ